MGLIAKVANSGDAAAFAELYDKTSAKVFGVVLRIVRDRGFAEDVTQEVYLQVWHLAGRYDPAKGSPLSWLVTLARRRAVDRVRVESSNSAREVSYQFGNQITAFDEVADEVQRRWEHRALSDRVSELSQAQQEAISLAYYASFTYREVADYLSEPLPTIKSRIRAGLALLTSVVAVE